MKANNFFWIMWLFILLFLIGVMIYSYINGNKYSENKCLNDTATSYCSSLNKQFVSITIKTFNCKDIRELTGTSYLFTEDELNKCMKGG